VLPRRLGARFALEALFLVLLAIGAGLADLRPLYIVIVMVGAWALVALAELSAERIDRAPLSYLQPQPAVEDEGEPREVFGSRPEERTVVAPPEQANEAGEEERPPPQEPSEQQAVAEGTPRSEPAPEPEPEPAAQPLVREGGELEAVAGKPGDLPDESAREEAEPEPALPRPQPAGWGEPADEPPATSSEAEAPEPRRPRRLRSLLRRREPEVEPEPAPPPRHVKLLPRRPADEPSRASQEVAELFGSKGEDDEPAQPEESTR
jgi:hypothetical protein